MGSNLPSKSRLLKRSLFLHQWESTPRGSIKISHDLLTLLPLLASFSPEENVSPPLMNRTSFQPERNRKWKNITGKNGPRKLKKGKIVFYRLFALSAFVSLFPCGNSSLAQCSVLSSARINRICFWRTDEISAICFLSPQFPTSMWDGAAKTRKTLSRGPKLLLRETNVINLGMISASSGVSATLDYFLQAFLPFVVEHHHIGSLVRLSESCHILG